MYGPMMTAALTIRFLMLLILVLILKNQPGIQFVQTSMYYVFYIVCDFNENIFEILY